LEITPAFSRLNQGRRQKNFQGVGATKKDRKIAPLSLSGVGGIENSKKDRKIALLSLYY